MAKILVVEDDPDMQFVLEDNLTAEGYTVDVTASGHEAVSRTQGETYDLVLLDIMLPDINGVDVCKLIRADNRTLPIIMLSAKGDVIDRVVGLEVGADDYVSKPFSMRELLARAKAAIRRSTSATEPAEPDTCVVEDRRIDFSRRTIEHGSQSDRLTRYESDLLRFLASHRGQIVSRAEILEHVWGVEATSSNRTVDNYIARLRTKVEPDPANPRCIITEHGSGYRLV